ncbi:MAG TPA: hypothetical protein VNF51_00535 [Candidatus Paceibacterota bacterium]|nr:hypothetical protein [Candidatus Paceibacterota bacterium]
MERLNFPSHEQGDGYLVLVGNLMQQQLAERHGETIETFIERHAAQFRDVLNKHPEYIAKFDDNAEETLQHIETILYH